MSWLQLLISGKLSFVDISTKKRDKSPQETTKQDSNLFCFYLFLFSFRWTKLRSAMCPHTIFLEPLSECMLLGCLSAWAVNFLFRWDPISFFLIHVLLWFIMDWTLLHIVQVIIHTTVNGVLFTWISSTVGIQILNTQSPETS